MEHSQWVQHDPDKADKNKQDRRNFWVVKEDVVKLQDDQLHEQTNVKNLKQKQPKTIHLPVCYLETGFYFKNIDVVDLVLFQYLQNRCCSENDDISKEEETEDITDIKPVADVRLIFSIQPLGVLYAK